MHGAKVALEVLDLDASLVIELVELKVLAPAHEDLPVLVQRGGVGRAGDVHLLQLLKPGVCKSRNKKQHEVFGLCT